MKLLDDVVIPLIRGLITSEGNRAPETPLDILLVEDCKNDVELVESAFSDHRLHIASSYKEAITLLRELPRLDAAFVDLNIPGGHGMDLVNRIMVRHPNARVVATPADASLLRPGDEVCVIMKHPRMAKSLKDFLKRSNGNGENGKVNYVRLFWLSLVMFIFAWLAGEFKWFEAIAQKLKDLSP